MVDIELEKKKKVKTILSFVVCLFAFFFCFSNVNAVSYKIYYNYLDKKVFDRINPNFIGENGYLEQVRRAVPGRFDIFFTSENIYVTRRSVSDYYLGLRFVKDGKLVKVYLSHSLLGTPKSISYIKLNDYNDFDSFLEDAKNGDNFKSGTNLLLFSNAYSFDTETTDFDFANYNSGNIIIPYYSSGGVSISTNVLVNDIYDGEIPEYYETYGYVRENPLMERLGSVDFLIPYSEITSFNADITYYSSNSSSLFGYYDFNVYGLKNVTDTIEKENGDIINHAYSYYDDLSYKYDNINYCGDTIGSYSSTSTSYTLNGYGLDCHGDLSEYSYIYLQAVFRGATDIHGISVNYSSDFSNSDLVKYYVNPFTSTAESYVIQENSLTRGNVVPYTTSQDLYNYNVWFSDGNITYDGVSYHTINIRKFDYKSSSTIDGLDGRAFTSPVYNNIYDFTEQVYTSQFGTSETSGLYFYANKNLPRGKVSHFYTSFVPTKDGKPIIYIGGGSINEDYLGFTGTIIDENGNIITNENIAGDFTTVDDESFWEKLFGIFSADGSGSTINFSISGFFSNAYSGASEILNSSISILSLVTDFFYSLPSVVRSLCLLIFFIIMIRIFIKFVS